MSAERFGPNSAHAYPPHITLTGFFRDEAAMIPHYCAALDRACAALPSGAVTITELLISAEFHGLLIDSPWLEALAAHVAAETSSPTLQAPLRLKQNLHLSLAYGFAAEVGPALGDLARTLVDPAAPVAWQIELYERHADGSWTCHRSHPAG